MFALFKKRNAYEQAAQAVYGQLLTRAKARIFYDGYGVPDNIEGRFEMVLLHAFLVLNRLVDEGQAGREFNQALFDVTFANMDQTLREMGIGDMGVPKRMKRMMQAFNGRMHAYTEAMITGDIENALRRNVYAGAYVDAIALEKMVDYMRISTAAMANQPASDILEGRKIF